MIEEDPGAPVMGVIHPVELRVSLFEIPEPALMADLALLVGKSFDIDHFPPVLDVAGGATDLISIESGRDRRGSKKAQARIALDHETGRHWKSGRRSGVRVEREFPMVFPDFRMALHAKSPVVHGPLGEAVGIEASKSVGRKFRGAVAAFAVFLKKGMGKREGAGVEGEGRAAVIGRSRGEERKEKSDRGETGEENALPAEAPKRGTGLAFWHRAAA